MVKKTKGRQHYITSQLGENISADDVYRAYVERDVCVLVECLAPLAVRAARQLVGNTASRLQPLEK